MLFIIKMSNYNIISRQNYGLVKGAQIMPRKGENIYKRKDGRWEGRFRKYRDANGKIKYGYVYARSYTEVKIKLNKIKQEITIPAESGTTDIIVRTFSEVVKEWITYKTPLLKESSVAKYTNIINLHLLPFFHEQTMQSISVQRLEEFYKKLLLKVTPKGTLLAPKTTLDILSVMKSILVYANTKKYLQYLPPLRFECRPLVKKLVILSERNQKILSSYLCLHLTYRNLGILICMYTGIRLGEICALTWEDISLTEGSIYIDKTIQRVQKEHNGKKTMLIIATPKTPSSIRTIPIPNQLLQIIKSSELPQKGYLLTGSTEKYIEPRTYQYHFKKLLQRCKIPETNFHALRHTFATRCVELGFDIKTLSEILGHSSINITLNRYVHPSFDLKKQNMNKMNELISFR